MTDVRNFLLNTDYPLDKVVYMTSGSLLVTPSGNESTTISHGLAFQPLMVFSHSDDPAFTTSKTNGLLPWGPAQQWGVNVDTPSSTTVRVLGFSTSAVSKTIYWRAYGLMPSNVNADADSTASIGSNFILNTDNNYMKLFMSDYITMPSYGNTTTITHGLGYRPRVQVWEHFSNGREVILSLMYSDPTNTGSNLIHVGTSAVTFRRGDLSQEATHYHYRIYIDD